MYSTEQLQIIGQIISEAPIKGRDARVVADILDKTELLIKAEQVKKDADNASDND